MDLSQPLPEEIIESMVQCVGCCFLTKDDLASFFLACDVSETLYNKYRRESNYQLARSILADLEHIANGFLIQRKLLTAMYGLPLAVPKDNAPSNRQITKKWLENRRRALMALSELVKQTQLFSDDEEREGRERSRKARDQVKLVEQRRQKLESLNSAFREALQNVDRQNAGFALETILHDLFELNEIHYKNPYRTNTEQLDGHFRLDGFDYLVEARWRKESPTKSDIDGFLGKVKDKMKSTRGLFISIQPYRDQVINEFNGKGLGIILLDGTHLTHILEGRMDLLEVLRSAVENAAQKGIVYTPI